MTGFEPVMAPPKPAPAPRETSVAPISGSQGTNGDEGATKDKANDSGEDASSPAGNGGGSALKGVEEHKESQMPKEDDKGAKGADADANTEGDGGRPGLYDLRSRKKAQLVIDVSVLVIPHCSHCSL